MVKSLMHKSEERCLYELALHFIPGIGAVHAKNLISYLGGIEMIFRSNKRTIMKVPGIGEKRCREILKAEPLKRAESELSKLKDSGIELVFYLDKSYPESLRAINNSPILLYKKGRYDLNSKKMIAVVGSRQPTEQGKLNCANLLKDLKEYDICIVSGLAYGIDTLAHRCAVDLDIPTIGILGSGMDRIYPQTNIELSNKMVNNGALLSEFPLGTKPDRENFPKRNRIIAAMSDAVIVVESGLKGGSIITAEYANVYSKDVFAVPGRVSDPLSHGCNHLIKSHKAHMIESIKDLCYIMRWDKPQQQTAFSFIEDLSRDERMLVELIRKKEVIGLDELSYLTCLCLPDLSSMLLNLEIRGIIKSKPGKKYILAIN